MIPPQLRPALLGPTANPAIRSRICMASAAAAENPAPYRLVISSRQDSTACAFVQYCTDQGLSVRHLWLDNLLFRWKPMISLVNDANGIYFRGIAGDDHNGRVLLAMRSVITRHRNVVMPSFNSRNWSKPMQAARTLARDDKRPAVWPVASWLTNIAPVRTDAQIVKSISGIRSQVVATSHGALRLDTRKLLAHPVQVQPRLVGDNIRVHVIGDSVFACTVAADTIDYRYGSELTIKPIELPPEVKRWCIEKTCLERLRLSGIDLLRDRDGKYFCFEINPMPGYDYFERHAFPDTRPISKALARELMSEEDG